MFEIAPSEMLLFAIVAIVVIGPKDLPKAMRFVGKWVGKARGMARHFRSGIDTMIRESELEELEKQWRAQNEAIMKAYPMVDSPAPDSGPDQGATAPLAGPTHPSDKRQDQGPAASTSPVAAPTEPAAPASGEKG
jgi:sec-independent protein translocase protein TatB